MEATADRPVKRSRWKRRLAVAAGVVVLLLATVAFLLPFLLKRYVEKHSEEWIGRKITIGNIILDPFTFTYAVNGFTCHEPNSDSVFVSWKSISVKADLWRGFQDNNWRFRKLRIEDPYFHIVQHGDRFNFSDLLELGGDSAATSTDTSTIRFSMEDIRVTGGRIDYASDILKAPVGISGLHAECNRISSESARMDFGLGLALDGGGALDGGFTIDTKRSLYAVRATLKQFTLAQLLPYLQDFMHTTALKGTLDAALDLRDSWADSSALAMSGSLDMQGLGLTDGQGEPLIGLAGGSVVLDTLNAREARFKLSRLLMDGFTTRFQQWADGSNTWTKVLKLDSTATGDSTAVTLAAAPDNIFLMLADYIRMLGQDFVANQYTADSVSLANSTLVFDDFTPEKPFHCTLDQLAVHSSRINTATGTADLFASARINGRGEVESVFKFDPKNFHNVDASLEVKDLSLPDLDAYSRWYAAYPISSGTLAYTGTTAIHDGQIDSQNHLTADELKFGKKTAIHDTGIYVLPLRLAASLLKDVHGKIDLDIPVEGNLNDPEFKPWPIIWKVLKNLVVKAAAAPVKLVAGALGGKDADDLEEVRFPSLATTLGKEQRRSLDALAALLKEKPELTAALVPVTDVQEETEEWAVRQMKMEFLGVQPPLGKADSLRAEQLSLRDSSFTVFLNGKVPGSAASSEQGRCVQAVGADAARQAVAAMEAQRQQAVQAYLGQKGVSPGRITFRQGTPEELAGHTGAPGFRFIVGVAD